MKKLILFLILFLILGVVAVQFTGLAPISAVAQEEVEVPFLDAWAGSPHADAEAEAFVHWDEDDPAEVPTSCAKCHSTPGYLDFVGVDGSEAGVVDAAAPIGTTVECVACHNEATLVMDSVVFPSGIEVTGLGDEARCMQCHQGRASTTTVDEAITEAGLTDMDTVSEDLGFTNIHYFAAAATQAGSLAMGGYQYEGKAYDGKFTHVEEFDTCIGCHDAHTLELKVEECSVCHTDVLSVDDLPYVRTLSSAVDYDGDGNTVEGIAEEIETLQEMLYEAMQAYATEVSGTDIGYDAASYPYFFVDTNGNGSVDADEAVRENGYNGWTGRLAKAAYNYQTSLKDPGAYAHGGKYIIQLLYDSIEDLNVALSSPVDLTDARRIDHGHFAGSEEAFRHWDEDGEVEADCAKCHSATGLPTFLKDGANVSAETANGFLCSTCHVNINEDEEAPRYEVTQVEFPSGLVIDTENSDAESLVCMNCHQGRQSTVSVNEAIDGLDADTVAEELGFRNVHYFAAGATRYGTLAKGAYEYDGQEYNGFYVMSDEQDFGCTDCHGAHTLEVDVEGCADCHAGTTEDNLRDIRTDEVDYDGNGDTGEGIDAEIMAIHEVLYATLQDYAANTAGTGIVYESHTYPYFFNDTNGNGEADADEANYGNQFSAWTPRLLQAAYNYQYVAKDPGAYSHNPGYVIQVMYDSISDLNGDVAGLTRPEVR